MGVKLQIHQLKNKVQLFKYFIFLLSDMSGKHELWEGGRGDGQVQQKEKKASQESRETQPL